MTPLVKFPGWTYSHRRDAEAAHEFEFYFQGQACGRARAVVFEATPGVDVMLKLGALADVFSIFDELETWLHEHPGRYVWLDSVVRTSHATQVKGQLTAVLHECLSHQVLGLAFHHEALAFPCPYGRDDDAAKGVLVRWYERVLNAHVVEGTPFVRFALSDDLGIMAFDLSTFEPLDFNWNHCPGSSDDYIPGQSRRVSKRQAKQSFMPSDEGAEVRDAFGCPRAAGRREKRMGHSRPRIRER